MGLGLGLGLVLVGCGLGLGLGLVGCGLGLGLGLVGCGLGLGLGLVGLWPRNIPGPYTPVRSLRSSDVSLLTQPLARLSIGRRAFSVCAPRLWNVLPLAIRSATSLSSFKRSLKTHYFQTLTPSWSLAIARASDSAIGRYLVIYL